MCHNMKNVQKPIEFAIAEKGRWTEKKEDELGKKDELKKKDGEMGPNAGELATRCSHHSRPIDSKSKTDHEIAKHMHMTP